MPPTITLTAPGSVMTGRPALFNATLRTGDTTGLSYSWHSAMAATGYANAVANNNQYSITYNRNGYDTVTLIATNPFGADTQRAVVEVITYYTVTAMSVDDGMGTVTGGGNYREGDTATLTATANEGFYFVGWNDGDTLPIRRIVVTSDSLFLAYFRALPIAYYTVTAVSADSTMGTVGGSGTYNYLSQVNISANASAHHHFLQWNDGNTSNPRMVTLTSDTAFTAIFEEDEQYTIVVNVNDSARGSLTVGTQAGVGSYEADYYIGENVTLIATANEHYYFSQWSDGVTSNPRVVTVIGAATYTAVFEPVSYPVMVTANDYSMGSVSGTGSYPYGSTVTIAAQAFDNYRFISWSDGDTMAVRSITVTGDMQFEARFEPRSHEGIEDIDGEHITVSVTDRCIVVLGTTEDYTIYDLAGRRHAPSEALATGVYLVQVGRWTKKVLVM
jgi:hypothetical protein